MLATEKHIKCSSLQEVSSSLIFTNRILQNLSRTHAQSSCKLNSCWPYHISWKLEALMVSCASPSTRQGVGFCQNNHLAPERWRHKLLAEVTGLRDGWAVWLNTEIFTAWVSHWAVRRPAGLVVVFVYFLSFDFAIWQVCVTMLFAVCGIRESQVFKDSCPMFPTPCAHGCAGRVCRATRALRSRQGRGLGLTAAAPCWGSAAASSPAGCCEGLSMPHAAFM